MGSLSRFARRLGLEPMALLGLAVLVGGTLVWVLTFTNTIPGLFAPSTRTVKADFATAEDVVPNDPVRINGVQVGTVGGVTLDKGGRGATVSMNLNSTAGKIYDNASASILWRTLLGANDAISLDPGTPGAAPLGSSTIPQSQTSDQVELDEITQVLHDGARSGLQTMFEQLGPAFSDHLAPEATFSTLAQVAPTAATGIGALRGVETDTDLKNLVLQTSRAAQALDVGSQAGYTRQFVQSAAQTLAITGAEHQNIAAILNDAGTALPDVTATAPRIDHALDLLDPLVAKLNPVAPSVAPTLADLHPALDDLNTLLSDAPPLLHTLRPTVTSLASTARTGVPVIDSLAPALRQVDTEVLPALNRVDPESKHTTYEMIGPVFAGTDSLAGAFNSNSHVARLDVSANQNVVAGDLLPCNVDFTAGSGDLLTCETLTELLDAYFAPTVSSAAKQPLSSLPALQALQQKYPAIAAHLLRGGLTSVGAK
jgi:virulence factor Mce-like protein